MNTQHEEIVEKNCKIERYGSFEKHKYWYVKYSDVIELLATLTAEHKKEMEEERARIKRWAEQYMEEMHKEFGTFKHDFPLESLIEFLSKITHKSDITLDINGEKVQFNPETGL